MKRITDEELNQAFPFDDSNPEEVWDEIAIRPLRTTAELQLQADRETVKASREQIAKLLFQYQWGSVPWGRTGTIDDNSWRAQEAKALEFADQIIKILEEE